MARLIDAEPIVKFIKDGLNNPNKEEAFGHTAVQILTEIEYAPTVDAAEVVRCKDCVYRKKKVCAMPYAGMWVGVELKDNDFCSYGERRGGK